MKRMQGQKDKRRDILIYYHCKYNLYLSITNSQILKPNSWTLKTSIIILHIFNRSIDTQIDNRQAVLDQDFITNTQLERIKLVWDHFNFPLIRH